MLTQQVIREEIEELKTVIANDSLTIPGLWECAKPGVMILVWLMICPLIAYSSSDANTAETMASIGFSGFLGFIILIGVTNARGILLSVPETFRKKSKVMIFLNGKIKNYVKVYMLTILMLSFFGAYSIDDSLGYLMPMMFVSAGFAFFFNADISRYKLSAFTEIVKSVSKK